MKENEDSCIVLPILLNIAHGNAMFPPYNGSRITSESAIVYRCDVDYRLEGTDTIVCLGNDSWSQKALPYCSDISWIGFKRATLILSIVVVLLVISIIICVIMLCRTRRKEKGQRVSRTNSDSSFESRENKEPLLPVQDQSIKTDDETLNISANSNVTHDQYNDPSNQTPAALADPVAPSAPPLDEKKDSKQPNTSEENRSAGQEPRGENTTIINLMINNINSSRSHDDNRQSDVSGNGRDPFDNIPTRNDAKSIGEKTGTTEESVDSTAAERGTGSNIHNDIGMAEENARGKKGKGTKPLPGRSTEKVSVGKGPQVIAAKRDSITTPTKETEQDDVSENIGISRVTFNKSDIKGMPIEVANEDGIESVVKETGLDDSSAKVGFDKCTFSASDIKMNELKEVDRVTT